MKELKNLEFIRHGYIDGPKEKSGLQRRRIPVPHPIFKSRGKVIYTVKVDPPETEKEVIASYRMMERIELAGNWTMSVAEIINSQKNMLLNKLMEIRIRETKK